MIVEATVHCEGPDCEEHAHILPDDFDIRRLPQGWVALRWYGGNNRSDLTKAFCNTDCAMKWCATLEPLEVES